MLAHLLSVKIHRFKLFTNSCKDFFETLASFMFLLYGSKVSGYLTNRVSSPLNFDKHLYLHDLNAIASQWHGSRDDSPKTVLAAPALLLYIYICRRFITFFVFLCTQKFRKLHMISDAIVTRHFQHIFILSRNSIEGVFRSCMQFLSICRPYIFRHRFL